MKISTIALVATLLLAGCTSDKTLPSPPTPEAATPPGANLEIVQFSYEGETPVCVENYLGPFAGPGCPQAFGENWSRRFQFRRAVAFFNGTVAWNTTTSEEVALTIWIRAPDGEWHAAADANGPSPLNFSFDATPNSTAELGLTVWPPRNPASGSKDVYTTEAVPFLANLTLTYQ